MTYWNDSGKYQEFVKGLQDLVPLEGKVENPRKNPKLERFRRASNCYYDLYNNGLCNRASEFYRVFGIPSSNFKVGFGEYVRSFYDVTEMAMNDIILEAATEQGLVSY